MARVSSQSECHDSLKIPNSNLIKIQARFCEFDFRSFVSPVLILSLSLSGRNVVCPCPLLVFSLLTRTPSGARVPCHAAAKTASSILRRIMENCSPAALQHCRQSPHAGLRHTLAQS